MWRGASAMVSKRVTMNFPVPPNRCLPIVEAPSRIPIRVPGEK